MVKKDDMEDTDEQLLERYAQGDSQAFERFFVRHKNRVYFYVLKKLHRSEVAAEATQDIFLKLHSKIHLYRSGERALPWFFWIVHNTCIDELRRMTSANKAGFNGEPVDPQVALESTQGLDNQSDATNILEPSMQMLSVEQRVVLEKRVIDDKSFKQISLETGKNEVALRKTYSRAVEKLRQWISGQNGKEDGDEKNR